MFFMAPNSLKKQGDNKPFSAKELQSLDLTLKSSYLPLDLMFVGKASAHLRKDSKVNVAFRKTAQQAFITGAKKLQEKLPLTNKFLQAAGGLNPELDSNTAIRKLLALPSVLPVFQLLHQEEGSDEAVDKAEAAKVAYDREVRKFLSDCTAPPLSEGQRIDEWWANVFSQNRKTFPHLQTVVKSVLSVFHGPIVESTFNLMGDILDERSGRMAVDTLNAYQTCKYAIQASGKSSLDLFRREDVKRDPVSTVLHKNMESAHQAYVDELHRENEKRQEQLRMFRVEQVKVVSKRKAIEAARNSAKKARMHHLKQQAKRSTKKQ